MACKDGKPLILRAVAENMPLLEPGESVAYAPTLGLEELRLAWKDQILKKNPSLEGKPLSLPAALPGLSAGISYAAELFVDAGQTVLSASPAWDNYGLIIEERRGGILRGVPLFIPGKGIDLDAFRSACREQAKNGQLRVLFNFPHNPSGYTPRNDEAEGLAGIIREAAEQGADVLVITDDAYFGLFFEDSIKESLFARFADLHEKVLAVKIDGPTKEDYVWGLRLAFLSFASKGMDAPACTALEKKLMGVIRSSVSCSNTPAQSIMLKSLGDRRSCEDKENFFRLMERRYRAVRSFVDGKKGHPVLEALPFNSGYFMSFLCRGISAETLRQELLCKEGIGTIALGSFLRVAFSSLEEGDIGGIYDTIYRSAESLAK
jgi:aspartate/methionine/tyrosine aminotransferase